MKPPNATLIARMVVLGCAILAPVSAAGPVCNRVTVEYMDIQEPVRGFAWEGRPNRLKEGTAWMRLRDRPQGDDDFVAVVGAASCATWASKVTAGADPMELRFYDKGNKLLGIGKGRAEVTEARCGGKQKLVFVRVESSFLVTDGAGF